MYFLCLFAYFRKTLLEKLLILSPGKEEIIKHLVPLVNPTPQWLAVSSGPQSRTQLIWITADGTTRYVLGVVAILSPKSTITFTSWSSVSIYRTENGLDWGSEGWRV